MGIPSQSSNLTGAARSVLFFWAGVALFEDGGGPAHVEFVFRFKFVCFRASCEKKVSQDKRTTLDARQPHTYLPTTLRRDGET